VKKRDYFTKYGEPARRVLEALLQKYADEGVENLESMEVLKVKPLADYGTPLEIIKCFGSKEDYLAALRELEEQLYRTGA
jgi:type I restriction enzyme R subunit